MHSALRTDQNRCQDGDHRMQASKPGPPPSDRIPSLRTCCGRTKFGLLSAPSLQQPPNGCPVPGFLLPLTLPFPTAGTTYNYSDFESCQDKPHSYSQTRFLAKPENSNCLKDSKKLGFICSRDSVNQNTGLISLSSPLCCVVSSMKNVT